MLSNISSHPYFLTPELSNSNYPLFVFLPGLDETGKELMYIQNLSNILPNHQIITLPHRGPACLIEREINLYQILLSANFTVA